MGENKVIILSPGPLTSFNNLAYNLATQLGEIRLIYLSGSTPKVELDLSDMQQGLINISVIGSLLSICKQVSRTLGYPIPTKFSLNPFIQTFLNHIDFFQIARKLNILIWDEKTVGGFWPNKFNPHTKLLYYDNIFNSIEFLTTEEINKVKSYYKQEIGPNFSLRCSNIFKGFNSKLEYTVENTALELIANSLIHAKDIAIVAVQRTSKKIIISVCDSGIGFKNSLKYSYPHLIYNKNIDNLKAIFVGSLIQEHQHGLRKAISEIIQYDEFELESRYKGSVLISSYDAEIKWLKPNWELAIQYAENNNLHQEFPSFSQIFGDKDQYISNEQPNGFWRKYNISLVGTRIVFEIPLI